MEFKSKYGAGEPTDLMMDALIEDFRKSGCTRVIAIGGGVSAAGEFLVKPIREKVKKMAFYKAMPHARIELATLGNDAGIIGAAMLGRI